MSLERELTDTHVPGDTTEIASSSSPPQSHLTPEGYRLLPALYTQKPSTCSPELSKLLTYISYSNSTCIVRLKNSVHPQLKTRQVTVIPSNVCLLHVWLHERTSVPPEAWPPHWLHVTPHPGLELTSLQFSGKACLEKQN